MKKLVLEQRVVTEYNVETKEMDEYTRYDVKKVINSIDPPIGIRLHKDIVQAYCEDADWNVEITGVK